MDIQQQLKKLKTNKDLKHLDISTHGINNETSITIADAIKNSRIESLNLEHNEIEADGSVAIANVLRHTQITILNLEDNYIGDEGAIAIAKVLKETKITDLNLVCNEIQERGAIAIADALSNTQLTSLNLGHNNVGVKGCKSIANVLPNTLITSLVLRAYSKQEQKYLEYISSILKKNRLKMKKLYEDFDNLVSNEPGGVEFVISDKGIEQYMDITKIILCKKLSYASDFCSKRNEEKDRIMDFIENIEIKLANFFSILDNSLLEHVKILLTCEKRGLTGVVENLLDHRPNYLLIRREEIDHPLNDILHPAVCILMHKYGRPLYFDDMRPTKGDLIKVCESTDWDYLMKEDSLGEFSGDYGKKILLGILYQ